MNNTIQNSKHLKKNLWEIIVIDDDLAAHTAIHLALEDFTFEGKSLRIVSTKSWEEAKPLMSKNRETVLLFYRTKKEKQDELFSAVQYIREVLKNKSVRILVRTENPEMMEKEIDLQKHLITGYMREMLKEQIILSTKIALKEYKKCHKEDKLKSPKILVVDDNKTNVTILGKILEIKGYEIVKAFTGKEAINLAKEEKPNLILLDIIMPELDGYEVCKELKNDKITRNIPIIFISSLNKLEQKIKGFEVGGIDYIIKPFEKEEILARVKAHIKIEMLQKELEEQNQQLEGEIKVRETLEKDLRILERGISAAHNGIVITDAKKPENPIIYVNHGFEKITGYSRTEVIGKNCSLLQGEAKNQPGLKEISQALAENRGCKVVLKNFRKDGTLFWNELTISPVYDAEGNLTNYIGVQNDITERLAMEKELAEAKELAETANHAKSSFLANMSHELRTPLNAILGFAQLLNKDTNLTPKQQENVRIINNAGNHLLNLINDILDLSKIEAGRVSLNETDLDIREMVREIEDMIQIKAKEKGLDFQVILADEITQFIYGDRLKLRQVLINLLSNAVKFTSEGEVILKVKMGEKPNELGFEITDSGIGIAADEIEKVFNPFEQTKSGIAKAEGTGLGLAISAKFVEMMGGKIQVNSQLGVGSTFKFTIKITPVAREKIKPKENHRRVIGLAPNQPTYRILVVDDQWDNRNLLVQLLSPLGFEVKEAVDGKEAIEMWEKFEPHLILMDMKMPGINGYEATKIIKSSVQGQNPVILAVTASAMEQQKEMILSVGCNDILNKPIEEEVILAKIAQHLGVRYLDEERFKKIDVTDKKNKSCISLEEFSPQLEKEWIEAMNLAIECADLQLMENLIEEIQGENASFAQLLQGYLDDFDYEKMLKAIAKVQI